MKKPVSSKSKAETSNYTPPTSPVKIPDGDTGFNLVKKNYNRFIWTWNEYIDKNKKVK